MKPATTGPESRSALVLHSKRTLQNISHDADVEHQLMFAGHNAYRFAEDDWYKNGFVPSVKQLVERIQTGF